ncbi:hypothetical protein H0H81_008707 [Sphagnurus paluster]|uniref:Uncharacterized protein n=1 Tax=Sphagnurus paluster TaxID=117069 RepID=A0A9P7GMV7_9AGAR|nr:hypothetical protein H0H81_008707 [Sphagnurus paluster]
MSDKTARTHSHGSNRAKNRDSGGGRKVVFKGVLDNPFRVQWPSVPLNVQNIVLAQTLSTLDGIANHHAQRKRKRRESCKDSPRKKRENDLAPSQINTPAEANESEAMIQDTHELPEPPAVLKHLVIGINEVTKRLEMQIRKKRLTVVTLTEDSTQDQTPCALQVILVCRGDIDPPILIDHLPHLVAAYNSLQPKPLVHLIPLAAGAELSLSRAIGLRRAAVLGFDSNWPDLEVFMASLRTVPTLTASWMAGSSPVQKLIPTHIKQLRTSAPKDMKAEKERRKEEKKTKKESRTVLGGIAKFTSHT